MKKITQKLIIVFFILGFLTTIVGKAHAATTYVNSNDEITLNGSVNPGGSHTTSWFEWGNQPDLNTWNETTHIYVGATDYAVPVSATLVNLDRNTTYYYRIVSENNQTINKGNISSFSTNSSGKISKVTTKNTVTRNSNTNTRSQSSSLSASPILGVGSLPNNVFGWLILILVIVCIIAVIRRIIQR